MLLDSDSLRACIPGAESLNETSPDHFDAVMRVGVAAIKGTARISLIADGDETKVTVDGDGQVAGKLAGAGQRMLPGVAKLLMNRYFECLRARMAALVA